MQVLAAVLFNHVDLKIQLNSNNIPDSYTATYRTTQSQRTNSFQQQPAGTNNT